tara:strand:- start:20358 stop:21356 length:999 start_codon:yes stop_codon:yes gene_type:complete
MSSLIKIIAEAGCNHNGKFDEAVKLIEVAKDSGADSVKFQIIFPEDLYNPFIIENGVKVENPVIAQRNLSNLSDDAYIELSSIAKELDIEFSASVFCRRSLDLLLKCNPAFIKLASVDLNNHILIKQAAETELPLILSTGFSSKEDIIDTLNFLDSINCSNFSILHCVSVYPAPTNIMNLKYIDTIKSMTKNPVGLSDHSDTPVAAIVASSMGIEIIEKHFTLDRNQEGFDHGHSMDPIEFKNYISCVREAESSMIVQPNKLTDAELEVRERARRGLYYKNDINTGKQITIDDIHIVRPSNSLTPSDTFKIIGKTLIKDVQRGDDISFDDIG